MTSRQSTTTINILGIPEIIQGIFDNRKKGTLLIKGGDRLKYIYFYDGMIRLVVTPGKPSILEDALRYSSLDTDEKILEEILSRSIDQNESLCKVLLDMEVADPEGLVRLCQFQIMEDLWEIFSWTGTFCEFTEAPPPFELFDPELLELPVDLNPEALLMESARRSDEWQLFLKTLPSFWDIPTLISELPKESVSEEVHTLSLIDGIRDIEEILKKARLPRFEVIKRIYELTVSGILKLKSPQELLKLAVQEELLNNDFKRIKLYERASEQGIKEQEGMKWLLDAYERVPEFSSLRAAKYSGIADFFWENKQYEEAASGYRKVVTYNPDNKDAYERLFQALKESNQLEEASKVAGKYATLTANIDKKAAVNILKEAQSLFSENTENYELIASFYIDLGDSVEAILNYEKLASLYHQNGDSDKAIEIYSKILELDRENIEARVALANVLIEAGRHEDGVSQYKELAELLYSSGVISNSFMCRYLINACETIIYFEPDNITAREWLADTYIFQKDDDKAKKVLRDLLPLLEDKGDPYSLTVNLKKIVDLEPLDFQCHRRLAECYLQLEQKEEAISQYILLGTKALEAGEVSEAYQALESALELEQFNINGRKKRAEVLEKMGNINEASKEYNFVGQMYQILKKYEEAASAFTKAKDLSHNEGIDYLLNIGRSYEELGKPPLAVFHYRRFIMGSVKYGNYGAAIEGCNAILKLQPNDPNVLKQKKEIESLLTEKRNKPQSNMDKPEK